MADSYVCSGAMMRCTMGTTPARLTVLPIRTVFLTGQPMANISDHLTMVNLASFGRCRSLGFPATASATAANHGSLTPMPCMHNTPFPWMGGKNDYIVKGNPALLKSSTCQCMWGGTISIIDDGQHGEGTQWIQKNEKDIFEISDNKEDTTDDIDALVDLRPNSERKSLYQVVNKAKATENRKQKGGVLQFLAESKTGGVIWNNKRFHLLERENASYLETNEGKKRLNEAMKAFNRVKPSLHSVTYNQLYQLVGQTLGLKNSEVAFKKANRDKDGLLGWHPEKSKDAILNKHEEANMSMCQKIAVYAHESAHVAQDIVIKNARKKEIQFQTPYERKLVHAADTYTTSSDDYEKYYHNFKEVDSRRYEIIFGKACVDYYNQTRTPK